MCSNNKSLIKVKCDPIPISSTISQNGKTLSVSSTEKGSDQTNL